MYEDIDFLNKRLMESVGALDSLIASGDYHEAQGICSDIIHFTNQIKWKLAKLSKEYGDNY